MIPSRLGPYELESVLGQGGMGTVYAAVNSDTGQRAAIKVLATALATKSNFRSRFESEIETLKRLKHPHIVQLLGYGEQDDVLFYAMELVEGPSLQDELRGGRVFRVTEVIRYGIEIASALKLAHDSGVIHRDLKPANLLHTLDDHIKLTDFGIAKLFGGTQLTADGGMVGTVDYMSPEQAEGKPVTNRSDLYAVGALMYGLLARRPPFTGRSMPQIVHAVRYENAVPLRRLVPDVPEQLERIIHQLMEKDPAQRLATALILGNHLKALEHGLAAHATRMEDPPPPKSSLTHDSQLDAAPATSLGSAIPSAMEVTWDSALAQPAPPLAIDRVGPTMVDGSSSGSHAAVQHFTTAVADERRRTQRERETQRAAWLSAAAQIGGIVLLGLFLVIGGWIWWRPPSADTLYRRIEQAAGSADENALAGAESELDQFLASYPRDPRRSEIAGWKDRLKREQEQRRFERRARRGGDRESLNVVERLYAEAMQWTAARPDRAVERLEALLDLCQDDEQLDDRSRATVELARRQHEQLQPVVAQWITDEQRLLERRLADADRLRHDQPEAAGKIYRGIVELHADKPWAAAQVGRARAALR